LERAQPHPRDELSHRRHVSLPGSSVSLPKVRQPSLLGVSVSNTPVQRSHIRQVSLPGPRELGLLIPTQIHRSRDDARRALRDNWLIARMLRDR
jgi:hypothetical protein